MRGLRLEPRTFGLWAQHADHCPIGETLIMLKNTSLPKVPSVGRVLEYARRAVLLVNAVVLTSSVRADCIGLAVEEEIVVVGVVKGVVAVVVAIRAMKQRNEIVEVGSR